MTTILGMNSKSEIAQRMDASSSLLESISDECRYARTKNLIYAESAVKYVESKLFLGSGNKSIDAAHGGAFSSSLGDSEVRSDMIAQLRKEHVVNIPRGMLQDVDVMWQADQAEAEAMGNCGEQSDVAFKYLLLHTDAKDVSTFKVGDNHVLVVIGASRSDLESAKSRDGTYRLDEAPKLPEQAVFCDPWKHDWYPASEWPKKIRQILRETQSEEVSENGYAKLDDEEQEMFDNAGIDIRLPVYTEDWKEIYVSIGASSRENTVIDYQDFLSRHPEVEVPQKKSRAALIANAVSRADRIKSPLACNDVSSSVDGIESPSAATEIKVNKRAYNDRSRGGDMCR